LVEAALVMPVLLFSLLIAAEVIFLASVVHGWQRSVDVLADTAAVRISEGADWRPGWDAIADDEQARTGCGEPDVTLPDGTAAGSRVEVAWTCRYELRLVAGAEFPPATIRGIAVIPAATVQPSASPGTP
jgi:hypothetical protein